MKNLIYLLFLFISAQLFAETYYVSTTGTLAANSTETIRLGASGNSGLVYRIKEFILRDALDSEANQLEIVRYLNSKYSVYE